MLQQLRKSSRVYCMSTFFLNSEEKVDICETKKVKNSTMLECFPQTKKIVRKVCQKLP